MLEMRNFIGGEWTHGETTLANINPSDTSDIIGDFAQGSISQLNDAVQAARAAQPKRGNSGHRSCGGRAADMHELVDTPYP